MVGAILELPLLEVTLTLTLSRKGRGKLRRCRSSIPKGA